MQRQFLFDKQVSFEERYTRFESLLRGLKLEKDVATFENIDLVTKHYFSEKMFMLHVFL